MQVDWSINFLVGSILASLGFLVISVVVLLINNLYSRFWTTVELFKFPKFQDDSFVPPTHAPLDK